MEDFIKKIQNDFVLRHSKVKPILSSYVSLEVPKLLSKTFSLKCTVQEIFEVIKMTPYIHNIFILYTYK